MGANWEFKILIDGACPLCRREEMILRRLDKGRGRLAFEDISAPSFDPSQYGKTMEEVSDQIHGVLPSGRVVRGMEVFRRAYDAVDMGWLTAPTNWPILKPIADAGYRWFARNRHRLTGRSHACTTDRCSTGAAEMANHK